MKKIIVFILTVVLLVNTFLVSVSASTGNALADTGVTPRWTNCVTCDTSFGVIDDNAEIFIDYYAREELFTHAVLTVTVQKRFLLAFWKDMGEWTTTSYEHSAMFTAFIPVDGSGKYRCHFYFEFYGNTGEVDIVEHTNKYDYEG